MIDSEDYFFSPNTVIDSAIKEMLPSFSSESQVRMQKAILNAKKSAVKHRDENTDANARHIFREFIPAFVMNNNVFAFEYEKPIKGKKPDWVDSPAKMMMESYTYERYGSSPFLDRLTSSITDKCNKYREIITATSLRLVVAVYLDFFSGVLLDDCREDQNLFRSIFDGNDSLWAMLFFTETQVLGGKQTYGFFCICKNNSFEDYPNWPFDTMTLNK